MSFCNLLPESYWKLFLLVLGLSPAYVFADDSFKCPEQFGYYPDYQDCSKYYLCVFGDSLHEKCTGGLYFSVELQTCDWQRNVECANGNKGDKPAESAAAKFEDSDDEIFSYSRRTSATASSNRQRTQNSESIPNYQSFENEEQRDYQRSVPRNKDNEKTRSSQSIPNPELVTKQQSSVKPTNPPPQPKSHNPTTHADRTVFNGDNPQPTLPEDPLYHGDERSKVSDPLDNYDPQQPDFDEAAPPLIDSEGGIHIADGGHGLDAFAGLSHLPGLGDYSVIAKPIYNANDGKAEESDYKVRDQRKTNSNSGRNPTAVSTKPRSLEIFQSNNGKSKDPDVVIDYSDGSKDTSWRQPHNQRNFATPSPIIFDDADHRDYGPFDIITPLKTNIQADHDASIDRVKISSIAKHDSPPQSDTPRNNDRARVEVVRSNKVPPPSNGEKSFLLSDSNGSSSPHRAHAAIQDDSEAYVETDHKVPRLSADHEDFVQRNKLSNRNVVYRSHITFNQQQSTKENDEQNRNLPNTQGTKNTYNKLENSQTQNPTAKIEYGDSPENPSKPKDNPTEFQRQPKTTNNARNSFAQVIRDNANKDHDSSIIEEPVDADFGIYTGNQRQNRKLPTNADENSKTIIPAESIQPAVRQPNQIRPLSSKDKNQNDESGGSRNANPFPDKYDDIHLEYGEYDSPKPHFTDYYTNHNDQESTTRSTTQLVRTRPTRPRKPITTTTTTTTTTTPAPIRVRSRRPINQATPPTNKPNYLATTQPSPPHRPQSIYSTPQPYLPSQKCDPRKCKLPDCRCGGTDIPNGLSRDETPQIIVLTFDDAVNELNHDLYNELFDSGRSSPNGCPILGTFYVSHEWTDYGQVQTLYSKGHEIASHSITHSYGEKFSKNQWMREIQGQREILHLYGGVRMEDIRGMRAPFLQIGGNKMFEMLYDANFTYDSSMPVYENNPPFWPYTLDYALNHECMIFPCPNKNYPGLWEIGMVMWVDLRGGRCSMGDACSNPPDEETVTKMLMKNFNRHYKSNRAPFGLFYHSAWFNTQHHRRGFVKFLDEILAKDDVYLVTNWQLIQWMRDPVPLSKVKDFEPFNCRKMDRPPPCPTPTVCNVWYQGGVRYMKTCQPCPAKYPWIGNTGYDIKNKG